MDYLRAEEFSPPPLDNISSAGGTECEFEDYDLEVNAVNSCTATSIAPKQYKSFQPAIKLQPTDLVYREEHSRAAPRKGIEPKAFLTIGETKQEHAQYVGRQKQPVTAPTRPARQSVSAVNTRKQQQRQTSVHSAPATNRSKSRLSRTASAKGRQSAWSAGGYTPLPVAPPPTIHPKENTYIHHPFKQDLSHEALKLDPSNKRPVSPGEQLKNSTILATMEVGRYINQREKTPNVSSAYREPKLLKARLRPLHTVNVTGPSVNNCQGIQADERKFGPSPMKLKQQKQLDDVIKKNAALKDISVAHFGSRTSSSKADSRRKSSGGSKVRLKTPESSSSTKREPTPSPYSSITQLDKAGAIAVSSQPPMTDECEAMRSRAQSTSHSEASHTEQQTMARSVSAVTIRHRESATPASRADTAANGDELKGTVFMTDADSTTLSGVVSEKAPTYPQRKPPAAPKQQGCKGFEEVKGMDREEDDEDDSSRPANHTTALQADIAAAPATNAASGETQQGADSTGYGRQRSADPQETNIAAEGDALTHIERDKCHLAVHGFISANSVPANNRALSMDTKAADRKLNCGSRSKKQHYEPQDGCTFITAGFLTLESMIKEARNMLRHSYSLNDLDKSCDWDQPMSSPRSVEVLNKEVTFADKEELHYYTAQATADTTPEELPLVLHSEPRLDLVPVKEPLLDAFNCPRQSASDMKLRSARPSCVDDIQRELAVRDSPYGVHGVMSEYLTTTTLIREIYPPAASAKSPQQRANCSTHAPTFDLSSVDTIAIDCVPANPPTTPRLESYGGSLTPVSECFTPDDSGSVFSDWESSSDDGKCFLETIVDLLPQESKKEKESEERGKQVRVAEPLPDAVEGRAKPVTTRQNPGAVEPIASIAPACFRINSVAPEGQVFYFTYDADLNQNRFATLIGRPVTDKRWALLFGFQLVFNKQGVDIEAGSFANIEANPYTSTEGAVYSLSYEELGQVDAHHGYPTHYSRIILPVWMCNSNDPDQYNIAQYCVPAVTYIAQDVWTSPQQTLPASSKEFSLRQVMNGSDQMSTGFREHLDCLLQECCC